MRKIFPSADLVGNFTVFNIKGNHYRLITRIDYESQLLFIRAVLTHAGVALLQALLDESELQP